MYNKNHNSDNFRHFILTLFIQLVGDIFQIHSTGAQSSLQLHNSVTHSLQVLLLKSHVFLKSSDSRKECCKILPAILYILKFCDL